MKAAPAFEVPTSILLRADEVIRIAMPFAAAREDAIGTKRTCEPRRLMSAFESKADSRWTLPECLLMTLVV